MIDLHIHSTASDGSFSPFDILDLANQSGVSVVSITDHDTIDGVKQLFEHPLPAHPELITGVEMSCTPPDEFKHLGSIHLLGYGFSLYDRQLNAIFDAARRSREQRNPEIIEKLNALGIEISMADVINRFSAEQIGRPHIAEVMKEKGDVSSFREAFDRYLAKGKPGYVDKYKIHVKDAIQAILNAGGVPVLAHPGLLTFKETLEEQKFIDQLAAYGLMGLEVFYTDHDASATAFYHDLAIKKSLIVTGGSDFHGSFNSGVDIGSGKGNLDIDVSVARALLSGIESVRAAHTRLGILETNLGYQFADQSLLNTALCHRSYLNENQTLCDTDNERLEFLGDAVLGLCVGQLLMEKSPSKREGELSKLRASLVSEPALADMARYIDLGRFIRLGKGESLCRGFEKNSILSDTFEAVIAAVYLDAGFDRVYALVLDLFSRNLADLLSCSSAVDYKSMLQEYAQERGETAPQYVLIDESGPDHDKTFHIATCVSTVHAEGTGKTKKAAEQAAARAVLETLGLVQPQ